MTSFAKRRSNKQTEAPESISDAIQTFPIYVKIRGQASTESKEKFPILEAFAAAIAVFSSFIMCDMCEYD